MKHREPRRRGARMPGPGRKRGTGSLTRRMIVVAAVWISILLAAGGFRARPGADHSLVRNFDEAARTRAPLDDRRVGDRPGRRVRFNRPPADQRFIESYSGSYFQISRLPGADTCR
jgi:hypothetical protein